MKTNSMEVVTRIAPSPTGNLHVGTARSALFNYLYAKKMNGKFIVRVEDTDKERSTPEHEKDILDGLAWLGLEHDELYRQSERTDIYVEHIQKLIDSDAAYISKEPSKNDESVEVEVVRLRNPGKDITFNDEVRGEITFNTEELGDFVIARNINEPLYHLVVVIDDELMGITHVIRGEDHISNTPRQILIQEALGFDRPVYAHMPLILAPDRSKLSKRKGETSVSKYAEEFLPEALNNYLALLGWNPGTEQEIFSMEELIGAFSLEKIQKGGAIFDVEKLKSINHEYLRKAGLTAQMLPAEYQNDQKVEHIIPLLLERARTYKEVEGLIKEGEIDFYFNKPEFSLEDVTWRDESVEDAKKHLTTAVGQLGESDFSSPEKIKESVWEYASEVGRGSVLWPLRYSLTGREKSPDPFTVAYILGKDETLARLNEVINRNA